MDPPPSATGPEWRSEPRSAPGPEPFPDSTGQIGTPSPTRKPRGRAVLTIAAGALLAVALIVIGVAWWYEDHFVSTDDAFIDTRIVEVAPQVAGDVIGVPVVDNQPVAPGQVLVQIDPRPYRIALEQALAAERQARTALGQARANVAVAQATSQQAIASLASAHAQAVNAAQELKRYLNLRARNDRAVSRSQIDQVMAAARSATAERRAAQQRVVGARAQIAAARAALAGAVARVATAHAEVSSARLSLSYTTVTAAVAGHIAQKSVAVGSYVAPGQAMMAVVPLDLWVTANFRETDLGDIRPGQRATIHIDACPARDARGRVASIQRGAGQAFDLLPPQNATGNYVKIVQRVPVRIEFDAPPGDCVLGPGMSVEPKIRVR